MVDDLKALEVRVSRGLDWLFAREQAGKTDAHYDEWFRNWEAMLRDYEYRLTHLGLTRA